MRSREKVSRGFREMNVAENEWTADIRALRKCNSREGDWDGKRVEGCRGDNEVARGVGDDEREG